MFPTIANTFVLKRADDIIFVVYTIRYVHILSIRKPPFEISVAVFLTHTVPYKTTVFQHSVES